MTDSLSFRQTFGPGVGVVSTTVHTTTGPIGAIHQAQLIDGR